MPATPNRPGRGSSCIFRRTIRPPASRPISAMCRNFRPAPSSVRTSPCRPQQTHPLAYKLIRVLDRNAKAVGGWDPQLSPETLRRGLRAMMLTRAYDDRMFRQQRQGKITFYMKCTGEEAIGVGQAFALAPDDMVFPVLTASRVC